MPLTESAAHVSFTAFVRVRSDRLHDVAWLVTRNSDDAKDAVQDALASPVATDAPFATACKLTDVGSVLYPFRVSVRVFGDGRTGGLGKLTALYLRANGFQVIAYSEASSSVPATVTTIRGFATDSPEVRLVEKFFPGAVAEGDGRADHSVDVLVVAEPGQVYEPDANVPVSSALCLPAVPASPRPSGTRR